MSMFISHGFIVVVVHYLLSFLEPECGSEKHLDSDGAIVFLKEEGKKKRPDIAPFFIGSYTGFIFLNSHGKAFTAAYVFDSIQNITSTYNREGYFKAKKEDREPCCLPKFSAHILRHTFCARLCENERNPKAIQDVMGHRKL